MRSQSQISAFELRIGADVGGSAGHDELTLGEDIGAVGDFQALHHVLLDQQDGDAFGMDALDQREQLFDQYAATGRAKARRE